MFAKFQFVLCRKSVAFLKAFQLKVSSYFSLLRIGYHPNFSFVIVGAFLTSDANSASIISLSISEISNLLRVSVTHLFLVYISFNLCLYGALYTLNALSDIGDDRKVKPWRPLPSGRVRVWEAILLVIVCVCTGFYTGLKLCSSVLLPIIYALFFIVNVSYSFVIKQYAPRVLSCYWIGVTAALRMALGGIVMGHTLPNIAQLLAAWVSMSSVHISRKPIERSKQPPWQHHVLSAAVVVSVSVTAMYSRTSLLGPGGGIPFVCHIIFHLVPFGIVPCFSVSAVSTLRKFYHALT